MTDTTPPTPAPQPPEDDAPSNPQDPPKPSPGKPSWKVSKGAGKRTATIVSGLTSDADYRVTNEGPGKVSVKAGSKASEQVRPGTSMDFGLPAKKTLKVSLRSNTHDAATGTYEKL